MRTTCANTETGLTLIVSELQDAYLAAACDLYAGAANEGFDPIERGYRRTYRPDTPHRDLICRNFERDVPAMLRQTARIDPVPWEDGLHTLLQALHDRDVDWWLGGSGALAARGVAVAPRDLDLVVGEASAYHLGDLLRDYLVEPVVPVQGWFCTAFGRAFIHMRVEWVGGVTDRADVPHITDFGPTAARQLDTIMWRGHTLRVPPLAMQLEVSERRGLTERAAAIRQAMG